MAAFLLYIIQSSCCLALFYLGYKTLLSRESCFRFNRKVLIGGMIVCLLLPLVKLKTATPGIIHQPFLELERMISPEESAPLITVESFPAHIPAETPAEQPFAPWILLAIWLSGSALMLFWLLRSFASLYRLIRDGARIRTGGYVLIVLPQPTPPFNWWKYIILSEGDYDAHPEEIIAHEAAHCRRRHSLDLAFVECILLLHWFNPAVWLLKRELRDVHEYEADTEALRSGIDATSYQLLLVKKAVGSSSYTLANSFNQSKLKKRITMMCLQKSNKWARWKLVLLLPVAACTLYAFARPDVNRQFEQLIPSESTTIPQDNKQIPAEMISSELNTQINALPERSRYQWLKENYHTRTLWVNSKAVILYDNDFATRQQLPDKLAKSLQVDYANNKPVLVYCLYDRDAPVSAVDSIRQIVVSTVKQYSASLKAKGLQVYIYEGDPHMFASTSKGDPVVVTFYEGAEATTSLVIYNDNTIQVKSDINKKGYGNVSLVRINAPKDTPMGKIADIKEAIRQLWEENGLDSTGLQYIYRIQQTLPVG